MIEDARISPMTSTAGMRTLIKAHQARLAIHADLYAQVAAQAQQAQQALADALALRVEARLTRSRLTALATSAAEPAATRHVEARAVLSTSEQLVFEKPSRTFEGSRALLANTIHPTRDLVVEGLIVLPEDRQLDFIGPPYPDFWTSKAGNTPARLQTVWANTADGGFGFGHQASGTVNGVQALTGAGLYLHFRPRIAPGIAQIRPYMPFLYQWASTSFVSREDNQARIGLRVWSWDLNGRDMSLEQDHQYLVWNNTIVARYFGTANSPSWEENQDNNVPEWDSDHGLKYDQTAPYFKTRENRVYVAAVWCTGMCWSISPENRPGQAIGRLSAQMPLVVIGYQ